ncbi:hypothetical protein AGR9A_Lc20216 [Agrobacterium salinitolerans str. Hayward 0363]|nr:hypothetical protein AGR9A_Lc20216 [Agrobacterium salinitolerans str. Hayward 0363]
MKRPIRGCCGGRGRFHADFLAAPRTVVPGYFIAAGCDLLKGAHITALSAMDTAFRNVTLGLVPRV